MTISARRQAAQVVVRCHACPGEPVLPTPNPDVRTDRCIRCQGKDRMLPLPHPEDHLCAVCRRECPTCQAPTTAEGQQCHACRGKCCSCQADLPSAPAEEVRVVAPEERKDRKDRWARVFFPRSWEEGLCPACQAADSSPNPVRRVLAAIPEKVMRACGGTAPPALLEAIRGELHYHKPNQLVARIERRWFGGWSHRLLKRDADEKQDGYRPDDVAVWLVAPPPCRARCDDGWVPGDPDRRCPHCTTTLPRLFHTVWKQPENDNDEDQAPAVTPASRPLADALVYRPMRECDGKEGGCGLPVAAPYTRCPDCLDWPRCRCGQRYDPDRGDACRTCRSTSP